MFPLQPSKLKAPNLDKVKRPNQTTTETETGVDDPTMHPVHAGGLGEVYRVGLKNLAPPPLPPLPKAHENANWEKGVKLKEVRVVVKKIDLQSFDKGGSEKVKKN